jgi:hypothetical protein
MAVTTKAMMGCIVSNIKLCKETYFIRILIENCRISLLAESALIIVSLFSALSIIKYPTLGPVRLDKVILYYPTLSLN